MARNYAYSQGKKGKVVDADRVLRKMRTMYNSVEREKKLHVEVGYAASYALKVHEDMTMPHPNGGQAKFLEQPARVMKTVLIEMVVADVKKEMLTKNIYGQETPNAFGQAMIRAGRLLEKESRKLVPVDTAFLISSSFTTLHRG